MSRYFLDTNALIDLVFVRSAETHAAMKVMVSLCDEEDEFLISTLSLKDASYIIESTRAYKEVLPSPAERRRIASSLRQIAFEFCTICPADEMIARRAHENTSEHDYDDALIAESAFAFGADAIISSDRNAFEDSPVPKMSPQELAKALRVLRKRR